MSFLQRIIFFSILLCSLHIHVKAQKVLQATNDMMGGGGMGGPLPPASGTLQPSPVDTGMPMDGGANTAPPPMPPQPPSNICLLYTSPSPRDRQKSRMPSSA